MLDKWTVDIFSFLCPLTSFIDCVSQELGQLLRTLELLVSRESLIALVALLRICEPDRLGVAAAATLWLLLFSTKTCFRFTDASEALVGMAVLDCVFVAAALLKRVGFRFWDLSYRVGVGWLVLTAPRDCLITVLDWLVLLFCLVCEH